MDLDGSTKEPIKSEEENIIISARILNEINKIISDTADNENISLY